jgi:DNA-directed RNA polymerase specialized sigma24 family protein
MVSDYPTDRSLDSRNSSSTADVGERFVGTEEEFNRLFESVMRQFQEPLEVYLQQRQVPREQSEETVQDFFAKQYSKRTVFPRLHRWLRGDQTTKRCLAFLKACVLHHYFDLYRKAERKQSLWSELTESHSPGNSLVMPQFSLNINWAANILQVAMQDLQTTLLADTTPVISETPTPRELPYSNGVMNWRIFVERFCSPSLRSMVNGQKTTAKEIGLRLGLSPDQVTYRIQCLREQFGREVRQALDDSSMDGNIEQLLSELREALVLGGVHLPDLLHDLPATDADSVFGTAQIFSLVSSDQQPADEAIELLVPPEPSTDNRETKELWILVLRRMFPLRPPHPGAGPTENRHATFEQVLFSPQPEIAHLLTIKKMARNNGQREHAVLQQVYHLLYALAIARAFNVHGQIITSLPPQQRIHSLGHAACYPWVPEPVARELELAIRGFCDAKFKSKLD